jgi:type I restriction enzyme S subunit
VALAANPVATNQGFRSLVLRDDECPEFYYYLLKANRDLLESRAGGSTFREISGSAIKEIEFTIPAPAEQRRIASLLGALDDKIENSRAIVSTLEEIARALFRRRFVKFAGHDELEDSEIGTVSRGWRVMPVGEAVRVVGGSTPSTKEPRYWEGGIHCWATPKDLSGHGSPVLIDTARHITQAGIDTISSKLLPAGTVLLSSRAPVGYTVISAVPVAVNQGFIAIPPSDHVPREYVLAWLRENLDRIKANAGGTTFAEISKRAFRPIPMLVPPKHELEAFAATVRPMFEQIAAALRERVTLEAAHAALMPKLITGAMRVPDGVL